MVLGTSDDSQECGVLGEARLDAVDTLTERGSSREISYLSSVSRFPDADIANVMKVRREVASNTSEGARQTPGSRQLANRIALNRELCHSWRQFAKTRTCAEAYMIKDPVEDEAQRCMSSKHDLREQPLLT